MALKLRISLLIIRRAQLLKGKRAVPKVLAIFQDSKQTFQIKIKTWNKYMCDLVCIPLDNNLSQTAIWLSGTEL